jgi:hypothetical protein
MEENRHQDDNAHRTQVLERRYVPRQQQKCHHQVDGYGRFLLFQGSQVVRKDDGRRREVAAIDEGQIRSGSRKQAGRGQAAFERREIETDRRIVTPLSEMRLADKYRTPLARMEEMIEARQLEIPRVDLPTTIKTPLNPQQ